MAEGLKSMKNGLKHLRLKGGPKDGQTFEVECIGKDVKFLGEDLPGTYRFAGTKEMYWHEFQYQWYPNAD